jgi:regulator of replication initiation timing
MWVSNDERPEFDALDQLEEVLQHVTDELAGWRRRALKAEAERAALGVDDDALAARERLARLEVEDADLRRRLEAARNRVRGLLERLRFLEEQAAMEGQRQ